MHSAFSKLIILTSLFLFSCKGTIKEEGFSSSYPRQIETAMNGPYQYSIKAVGTGQHADSVIAIKKATLSADVKLIQMAQTQTDLFEPFFTLDSIRNHYREPLGLTYEESETPHIATALTVVEKSGNKYTAYVLKYLPIAEYLSYLEVDTEKHYNAKVLESFRKTQLYQNFLQRIEQEKKILKELIPKE